MLNKITIAAFTAAVTMLPQSVLAIPSGPTSGKSVVPEIDAMAGVAALAAVGAAVALIRERSKR